MDQNLWRLRRELFCCRPCLLGAQHLGRSEQQAAAATGSAVLNDPRLADLTAGTAQPESETRQEFIEDDKVGLAGRQSEPGDGLLVELHRRLWEAYGKR